MTLTLKKSNKFNLYDICFVVSAFSMLIILLSIPYEINRGISLGTYAIAGCSILALAKYLVEHMRKMPIQGILLLVLIVICVAAFGFSHSNIRANLVKLVCFLEIPIFMLCSKEITSKRTVEVFLWVQYALSFYYIYLSFSDKAHIFKGPYGLIQMEELTMSYHNPNEASMYLTCCLLVLMIGITFYKQNWIKILFAVNAIYMVYLINLTQSRAGIISALIAIIMFVCNKWIKINKIFTRTALVIPLVMAVLIYFFNEQLAEIKILGESMETGRKDVFEQVFSVLEFTEIFTGDFATHAFDNLHNVYISIFATIGIFGVLCYVFYFEKTLFLIAEKKDLTSYSKAACVGVLTLLVYSSVEATIFTGGSAFAVCFVSVYIFGAYESPKQLKDN